MHCWVAASLIPKMLGTETDRRRARRPVPEVLDVPAMFVVGDAASPCKTNTLCRRGAAGVQEGHYIG